MKEPVIHSLEDFYREASGFSGMELDELLPPNINKEIGHFNIFNIAETIKQFRLKKEMPYNRRAYFKISLIKGKNRAEYADKVIPIEKRAILFATPNVPYHWVPMDPDQSGFFCVFSREFMDRSKTGVVLDELPLFRTGGYPIFEISDEESGVFASIFDKMQEEITSDYPYKYDLIRNYVLELIHLGQKLQPETATHTVQNASTRIISLFVELLERQFPIESPNQRLLLRTASDFAERLSVHVNHLNKVLKDNTGKTTTEFISQRIAREAKVLLKETDWNVSEIAFSLGFEEVAHFSNFFKRITSLTPLAFRS